VAYKPQFPGEDVSGAPAGRNVDFCFSLTCVRLMIKGVPPKPGQDARGGVFVYLLLLRCGPRGRRRVVTPVRGRE